MLRETNLRWYKTLQKRAIPHSQLPAAVRKSEHFMQLLQTGILAKRKRGAGYIVEVALPVDFEQMLTVTFPAQAESSTNTGVSNVARYRNSKAAKKETFGIVMLRGSGEIVVNDRKVDLQQQTHDFGLFTVAFPAISCDKICFVENLDSFMQAEKLLGDDWVLAHTYGRFGRTTIRKLEAQNILHFPDYDYVGLDEYLRIKAQWSQTELLLPDNWETLFATYSQHLKEGASPSRSVLGSEDPIVICVREYIAKTNRMLEQQALFIDDKNGLL